ncbi:MAG: Asp/Glu racemase [Chloroflexota bacterium]
MTDVVRVGLIVPSSNTTMETEIPAMLNRRGQVTGEQYTFHSSRMRMKQVTPEELARMDGESDRCAAELADARCDVLAYSCLVAIMAQGAGYHCQSQERLSAVVSANGATASVVTSAGALLSGIHALGAKRVAIVAPYLKPLTRLVVDYIESDNIEVVDAISLEVADNLKVGRLDPLQLPEIAARLNTRNADAIVLSACVQMPSLAAIKIAEDQLGKPVLSAATATVYELLRTLGRSPMVPDAGHLLSGAILAGQPAS